MANVQANGITIEYERYGQGDPLLLIMGLGGQLISWPKGFIDKLVAQGFEVIAFDNRDGGLSSKGSWPRVPMAKQIAGIFFRKLAKSEYKLSDMANDAAGLLDALGIERAHVVGISMGGMIGQSLAIAHPKKVRSLTSIMSTTGNKRVGGIAPRILPKLGKLTEGPPETYPARTVEMFGLFSGTHYDQNEALELAKVAQARSYCPEGTARQSAAIMASPDRTIPLGNVKAPTLVIHGLEDTLVLPSGGIATAKAVPGSRLLMFPDMGHNLPKPRHDEIVAAIKANTQRA